MTSEIQAFEDSPRGKRAEETYQRAATDAQRASVAQLYADGKTAWLEKRNGKKVIAEFRRYVESGDPDKIGAGLYHFLMQKGGFIAHYDLDGFRQHYREVAHLVEELVAQTRQWRPSWQGDSQWVYKDGMTSAEVGDAILAIVGEQAELIVQRAHQLRRDHDLTLAHELAARHGFRLEQM